MVRGYTLRESSPYHSPTLKVSCSLTRIGLIRVWFRPGMKQTQSVNVCQSHIQRALYSSSDGPYLSYVSGLLFLIVCPQIDI